MKGVFCLLIMGLSHTNLFAQDYLVTAQGDTIAGEFQYANDNLILYSTTDDKIKEVDKRTISGYMKAGVWVDNSYDEVMADTNAIEADIATLNLAKAQEAISLAGLRLEQSRTMFYIGLACQIVGGGIMALSQLPTNNNPNATLYIGGAVAGAGSIVMLTAFIPIGTAGIELQKVRFK